LTIDSFYAGFIPGNTSLKNTDVRGEEKLPFAGYSVVNTEFTAEAAVNLVQTGWRDRATTCQQFA
jgi:hypothetical protein